VTRKICEKGAIQGSKFRIPRTSDFEPSSVSLVPCVSRDFPAEC